MERWTSRIGEQARRGVALLTLTGLGVAAWAAVARAAIPQPWELGMQPPATPIKDWISSFHDDLVVVITLITVFVLGLLLYVIVRFNHKRHPVPTRTSHNLVIEILWTFTPVVILVAIAFPSFKLMYYEDLVPPDAMTIKITGHQWYWTYLYPDQDNLTFNSNIIQDKDLKPGQHRLLEVDNRLVVPVNTNVRVQITSTDVIHSWFVPSFGVQEYAIAGRLNEAWFRVEHVGVYYGECNQICGLNHAFMPIAVQAVSQDDFKKWLVDAKKQFAANGDGGATLVADAATPAGAPTAPSR